MLKILKEIHCIRTNVLFYDIMKPKQDENKLFLSYSIPIPYSIQQTIRLSLALFSLLCIRNWDIKYSGQPHYTR